MERHAVVLAVFVFVSGLAFAENPARPAVSSKRVELENIQKQIDERKREIEEYRRKEEELDRAISSIRKEDSADQRRKRALQQELAEAQRKKAESEKKYNVIQSAYGQWNHMLDSEAAAYAWREDLEFPYYGTDELYAKFFIRTALVRKYGLLLKLKGEGRANLKAAEMWNESGKQIKYKAGRIETQLKSRKTVWDEKLTALGETRQRYQRLIREVEELKNSALGLTKLVQKLESKSPYRTSPRVKTLPIPAHSLSWPAEGRIVSSFGREEIPALKTWLIREGVRIRTAKLAKVSPVLDGKVIYAGIFRSYGKVVIVDHKEGFFTIYGLLDDAAVKKGDTVTIADRLGTAGDDTQEVGGEKSADSGTVYFEIRYGSDAVDPAAWLIKR